MTILTVGYVAGLIALAVAVFSILIPNLIVLLVAAFVGREQSATTWSVFARELHGSVWPVLLGSDSAAVSRSSPIVRGLSWCKTLAAILVTVAGVITPLGLHSEVRLSGDKKATTFNHLSDTGPFGIGTSPQDPDFFFTRRCVEDSTTGQCPFSNTKVHISEDSLFSSTWNGTYDIRVPFVTAEVFSSVHDDHPNTVAGAFDMQWRQYSYSQNPRIFNGSRYPVGVYRHLDSLLLHETIEPVEGLIVDTKTGGIGFRNHTAPTDLAIGGEWVEELLFISPETVCVDTNLSMDFQIGPVGTYDNDTSSSILGLVNVSLTDRGGFVNINHTYPAMETYPGQVDPMLWFRAYKAAWWNNVWTMLFFNVTNPHAGNYSKAFTYLDSHIGKKFYLDADSSSASYNGIGLLTGLGGYLDFSNQGSYSLNGTYEPPENTSALYGFNSTSYDDPRTIYSNPWRVTSDNFTDGSVLCEGAGGFDQANISILAVSCGLVLGAATRQDGKSSLVAEPGSWWTQPMYTCATTSKAQIKRVGFRWNSTRTEIGLGGLSVLNVTDRTYESDEDRPFWAVEDLHRDLSDMSPLWGLVSAEMASKYKEDENFDILQSEHLYVPGYTASLGFLQFAEDDNLAANVAPRRALGGIYQSSSGSDASNTLKTGSISTALYAKWQKLSGDASLVARIFDTIYTDSMANAITGTRSLFTGKGLPPNVQPNLQPTRRDDTEANGDGSVTASGDDTFLVAVYENHITYRWPFAIPALLALAMLALILFAGVVSTVLGRFAGPRTMSFYLNNTSAGRLLALLGENNANLEGKETHNDVFQGHQPISAPYAQDRGVLSSEHGSTVHLRPRRWLREVGSRRIDLTAIGRRDVDESAPLAHFGHQSDGAVE